MRGRALAGVVLRDLRLAFEWHLRPEMQALRGRIEHACPLPALEAAQVTASPVVFMGRAFDLRDPADDPEAAPAIVMPMRDEAGALHDLAAFAPDPPLRAARLLGRGVAVNLGAMFDARLDERGRVGVHASVWSFLRGACEGLLPVDWRATALMLAGRRIAGVAAATTEDALIIDRRLKAALKPPAVFVRTPTQEAA